MRKLSPTFKPKWLGAMDSRRCIALELAVGLFPLPSAAFWMARPIIQGRVNPSWQGRAMVITFVMPPHMLLASQRLSHLLHIQILCRVFQVHLPSTSTLLRHACPQTCRPAKGVFAVAETGQNDSFTARICCGALRGKCLPGLPILCTLKSNLRKNFTACLYKAPDVLERDSMHSFGFAACSSSPARSFVTSSFQTSQRPQYSLTKEYTLTDNKGSYCNLRYIP